jgi:hypothetical protein
MFQHAQEKRLLYKALVGKQGGDVAMKHIQKQLNRLIFQHLKLQLSEKKTNIPPDILALHFVNSFMSLLTWWLDNETAYSAEDMNNFYRQLVKCNVELFL